MSVQSQQPSKIPEDMIMAAWGTQREDTSGWSTAGSNIILLPELCVNLADCLSTTTRLCSYLATESHHPDSHQFLAGASEHPLTVYVGLSNNVSLTHSGRKHTTHPVSHSKHGQHSHREHSCKGVQLLHSQVTDREDLGGQTRLLAQKDNANWA